VTEKLYLNDSYRFAFESSVVSVDPIPGGYGVVLRATAFYPESGGQPSDRGLLADCEVEGVFENDNGDIVHRVEKWHLPPGSSAKGTLNIRRRLDNMGKHTGQHILSGAFLKVAGTETLSSRLGEVESTIELSVESLNEGVLYEVEDAANRLIREDVPVTVAYYNPEELDKLPVRKLPDRTGRLRIVRVGDYDCTACGGTHCRRSGEVGLIKIIGQEKMRGHLRVVFLTGNAALSDYRNKHRVLSQLTGRLTCHFNNLPSMVERLTEQNSRLRKEIAVFERELNAYRIKSLEQKAVTVGGVKAVIEEFADADPRSIRQLALKASKLLRAAVILACGDKLLVAVPEEIDLSAAALAGKIMDRYGGKGGGNASFAQIGGLNPEKAKELPGQMIDIIRSEVEK
jgi:alanyl-tRNA synthetase